MAVNNSSLITGEGTIRCMYLPLPGHSGGVAQAAVAGV